MTDHVYWCIRQKLRDLVRSASLNDADDILRLGAKNIEHVASRLLVSELRRNQVALILDLVGLELDQLAFGNVAGFDVEFDELFGAIYQVQVLVGDAQVVAREHRVVKRLLEGE